MEIIDFVSRYVHIVTSIVLIGGSVFSLLVLMPAAKLIPDDAHQTLAAAVTGRWKRVVHSGILLFLITGFYNYFRAIPEHRGDGLYHALIGTKMLLAFLVFFLAAALVGRSAALEKMRTHRATWLKVLLLLAAIVVGLASYAKVRGIPADIPPALVTDTAGPINASS